MNEYVDQAPSASEGGVPVKTSLRRILSVASGTGAKRYVREEIIKYEMQTKKKGNSLR